MGQEGRLNRRVTGALSVRLRELQLAEVDDPRQERGRRWSLSSLLSSVLVGMVSACKSLAEVESLTAAMSVAMRRQLGIGRRVPDTTMRDALVGIEPQGIRRRFHRQMKAAQRRGALQPVGLPFGVVAMDGKATATDVVDGTYAQRQTPKTGPEYGLVRTMTACLVSALAKPCLDACPIPASTNEMGHFPFAFRQLCQAYGRQVFQLVTYDAGACYAETAQAVIDQGRDYLFGLKGNQPLLLAEAHWLLGDLLSPPQRKPDAESVDVREKHLLVTRRLYLAAKPRGLFGGQTGWGHLRTILRVDSETRDEDGRLVATEVRYFVSSLPVDRLTVEQWLAVVRLHWCVENNCHCTWDKFFREDEHPWITASPKGMVVVMLLRRLAYNLVTLFRSVTQRSADKRETSWKTVLSWFYNATVATTTEQLQDLRARPLT